MTLYRIRDKNTGLYSKGGSPPEWGKIGKVWVALHHLNAHLSMIKEYGGIDSYNNAEIIVLDVKESTTIDVNKYMGL